VFASAKTGLKRRPWPGGMTLEVMSVRRIGVREYSEARARRTSFLTIWSWLTVWVSGSDSMAEETEVEEGEEEWGRVGGGEGEGSACWVLLVLWLVGMTAWE